MVAVNGQKITLADANDLEISFETLDGYPENWTLAYVQIISCNAAGVQVGNEAITGTEWHSWAAASKVPISFKNGVHNIHIKGTNADIIAITW